MSVHPNLSSEPFAACLKPLQYRAYTYAVATDTSTLAVAISKNYNARMYTCSHGVRRELEFRLLPRAAC